MPFFQRNNLGFSIYNYFICILIAPLIEDLLRFFELAKNLMAGKYYHMQSIKIEIGYCMVRLNLYL